MEALTLSGFGEGLGFAGRTDAGVHATGQVVAFRVPESLSPSEVEKLVQAHLPTDVWLSHVVWAPSRFHPRWSATLKRYVYRLSSVDVEPQALDRALDELRNAPSLDGFTAAGAPPKPAAPLTRLTLQRDAEDLRLTFEGPGFKRYAIRHMVGCAVAQATGLLPQGSCAKQALTTPPYRGPRAAADGLTLERVFYPPELDPFAQ